MKAVFLLPVVGQPRYWKRIRALRDEGVATKVLAFQRPYFDSAAIGTKEAEMLGAVEHGKYLGRVWAYIKAARRIQTASRDVNVIYAFGGDLAALGIILRIFRPNLLVVYEAGDIRPVMIERGMRARVYRFVERLMLRRVALIVATSDAYRDQYFVAQQRLQRSKIVIIENKVEGMVADEAKAFLRPLIPPALPATICYYGLIRCEHSWSLLRRIAERIPDQYRVVVWGHIALKGGTDSLDKLPPNMIYRGEYNYPEDLPAIYSETDLIWAAHAHGTTNSQWARANRFYDACCFGKPMIGQRGTVDADVIRRHAIGVGVDITDPNAAMREIEQVTARDIVEWQRNVLQLDREIYVYTNEHTILANRLRRST